MLSNRQLFTSVNQLFDNVCVWQTMSVKQLVGNVYKAVMISYRPWYKELLWSCNGVNAARISQQDAGFYYRHEEVAVIWFGYGLGISIDKNRKRPNRGRFDDRGGRIWTVLTSKMMIKTGQNYANRHQKIPYYTFLCNNEKQHIILVWV